MPNVYVLRSQKTGKKYVSSTSREPADRLREHNAGIVSFMNRERPYELIHSELFADLELARKREKFFKTGKGRKVLESLLTKK